MSSHFLYSTNTFMKKLIQETYRGDSHYVWCGENFDPSALAKHSGSSLVGPSSNPAKIYRDLKEAVDSEDNHCPKIIEQKINLLKLAVEWEKKGQITTSHKQEIAFMLEKYGFSFWRPVLFIIPRNIIDSARIEEVPAEKRASFGKEFIIKDLKANEFDLIEF
jgi:hypothetical protein